MKFEEFKEKFGSKEPETIEQVVKEQLDKVDKRKEEEFIFGDVRIEKKRFWKMSKEEQQELYKLRKMWETLTPEEREKIAEKRKEILNWIDSQFFLVPILIKIGNPVFEPGGEKYNAEERIQDMMRLGSIQEEFCTKFDVTPMEFLTLMRAHMNNIKKSLGMKL